MVVASAPLAETVAALRSGALPLAAYIEGMCDRIEDSDPQIGSLLPEPGRRERLRRAAAALESRYPDPAARPPLYGALVGVKDIIHADGFVTRAGTALPPALFAAPEAACVQALKEAGALVLGKTVTTEFAGFAQNGTRNPHNPAHTPGGSSSGSAAAVAAGFCPLALGTQTVGSVIRPAAFCGIVGFKPTYGRIPLAGIIPYAASVDTVGLFTQDVAGMQIAAAVACAGWRPVTAPRLPVLGVPEGAYLAQASEEGRSALERQLAALAAAGYAVRRVPALDDIAAIAERHTAMTMAEAAAVHRDWYPQHRDAYRPETRAVIAGGMDVSAERLAAARASRAEVRAQLELRMATRGIDLWACPPAPGPAPQGIDWTGNPAMNLPWTHAGLPAVTLPAGRATNGLPLGLQLVARARADERLLAWSAPIAQIIGEGVAYG